MEKETRAYKIIAKIPNAEIRACDKITGSFEGKDGKAISFEYLDLKVDDENLDRIYLKDKNTDNLKKYKRGMIGTFTIRIEAMEEFRNKYNITVVDFVEDKKGK